MDTLSHGLWGGIVFGKKQRPHFWLAFSIGMLPDLVSFGLFFITHLRSIIKRMLTQGLEPPHLQFFPSYVHTLYNVTHSLLFWALLFLLFWIIFKHPPLILGAWGLHILCDIPTHTKAFFPTPFLWPFPTPFVNGFHWATPWFLILNYSLLLIAGLFLLRRKKHKK